LLPAGGFVAVDGVHVGGVDLVAVPATAEKGAAGLVRGDDLDAGGVALQDPAVDDDQVGQPRHRRRLGERADPPLIGVKAARATDAVMCCTISVWWLSMIACITCGLTVPTSLLKTRVPAMLVFIAVPPRPRW
jgi:hypothetical protein